MSEHEKNDSGDSGSIREREDSTADSSDRDNDTFEDANDIAVAEAVQSAPERTRSLTKQHSSQSTRPTTDSQPEPPEEPNTNGDTPHVDDTKQPNSPLLTSRSLSTSSLDNVNLEDTSADSSTLDSVAEKENTPPPPPPRNIKPSLQGLSGVLPSVPWGAPPTAPPAPSNLPAPPPPTRKLTSPFSWLSRNATPKDTVQPPTLPSPNNERRNTASSIATLNSNPDMMLSRLDEGHEPESVNGSKRPARNSLRDRFKLLRMREEAGITTLDDDGKEGSVVAAVIGRSGSLGLGLASPTHSGEKELSVSGHPSPVSGSPNPSINLALAPGTASGVSAGPSASSDAAPVDWDLWQSVVYEGPAAVARTSPEELNRAIATGIPNAIRGVVWQVLAQSKNEELESVYRDLLVRGTDKDKDRNSGSSGPPSVHSHTSPKDEVVSSASSIHSDQSTPATTITNGMRSPSPPKDRDPEAMMKVQAASLAVKKKKAKEDAASLLKLEKAIKRDLGARTSYSKFAASAGLQEGLFGVCKSYALFDEGVGYAQGMNFLAMPLLFNMPEEEAFCLLVRLMNQYHLRDLFIQDMPGLHMHLYQFERLLEDFEPALYCHLHRKQVTPHLYATQWFLTLFAYRFPLQLVLRIYDLILSEGLSAILKFGIVLMQKNAATLLAMADMAALTTFLKDRLFDVYIDAAPTPTSIMESGFFGSAASSIDKEIYRADQMVHDACAVKITPDLLNTYATEWAAQTRLERDREAELDTLRSSNSSLTLKIRQLEERVQDHDAEHAALATDLVRTKVENETLADKNEALKIRVEELKNVVEKQPAEVEERLKTEMERLMRRNQEVHGDNTKLEDEMGEMEKSLVETKMMYAELNSSHEALTRKWTDLRKALD